VHVKPLPAHAVRALGSAPRGLSPAFVEQVLAMSDRIAGLSGAKRGLVAVRYAVLAAIAAIDVDTKRLVGASAAG